MTKKMNDITVIDDKLQVLVCKAHNIDAEEYPEMMDLINRFLVLDPEEQDYSELANNLMDAETSKRMPKEVVKFIIAAYESDIETKDDALAANNLASLYYGGRIGGEPDYKKARKYYEISDRLGYPLAAENLAYIYYYGFGIDVDYQKAYLYFSKAALNGRYEAMYKIGDMFRYGYYVEKGDKMTAHCYMAAANLIQNDHMASVRCFGSVYHRVADLYSEGIGVEKDLKAALHFYQMAETGYYDQIEEGDKYHFDQLSEVIEKQKKIRRLLKKNLPEFEF